MQSRPSVLASPDASPSAARPLRAIVRYVYQAEDANQLSLRAVGDIVTIHSTAESDDWWDGEFEGQRGFLPAKYVELVSYAVPTYAACEQAPPDLQWNAAASQHSRVASLASAALGSSPLMQNTPQRDSVSMYLGGSGGTAASAAAPLLLHSDSASDELFTGHDPFWAPGAEHDHNAQTDDVLLARDGGSSARDDAGFFSMDGRSRKVAFSLWSSSLGKLAGISALVTGSLTLLMGLYDHDYFKDTYVVLGAYAVILGLCTLVYELYFGRPQRGNSRLPWRSICYGALLVPMMVPYPTRVAGCLYFFVAGVNFVAAMRGESISLRARREARQLEASARDRDVAPPPLLPPTPRSGGPLVAESSFLPQSFITFFLDSSVPHRAQRWTLLLFYVCFVNAALVASAYLIFVRDTRQSFEEDHNGVPWNKWWLLGLVAQWLLLLNIVPFFFTVMAKSNRTMHDAAVGADQGLTSTLWNRTCKSLLSFLPPDPHHTILFYHKLIAAVILVWSLVHGLAHTLSFMVEPADTLDYYTAFVYTTGAFLIVILVFIYSVSTKEIRDVSMKLFRMVHLLYIPFMLLLLIHARNGFSLLTVWFILIPMVLWVIDKAWQETSRRGGDFPVLSVAHIRPSSLRLEVSTVNAGDKWNVRGQRAQGFEEGAFVYANFPAVSASVWIPLTISSAPPRATNQLSSVSAAAAFEMQESSSSSSAMRPQTAGAPRCITLHLPVDTTSLHSFSARVQEFFEGLGPLGSSHYLLDEGRRTGSDVSRSASGYASISTASAGPSGAPLGQGRLKDHHGRKLIRLDGPHPTPVSHVTRYRTCLVVAPSAGVASLSSVLRSVVLHRWRAQAALIGVGAGGGLSQSAHTVKTTPDVLFLCWTLPWHEIDQYRWMIQTIKGKGGLSQTQRV